MQPTSKLKKTTTITQKIKQNKKTATVTPYPAKKTTMKATHLDLILETLQSNYD